MVYRGIADDGSGGCQVFYENLTCSACRTSKMYDYRSFADCRASLMYGPANFA